jgi:hypothetical protein
LKKNLLAATTIVGLLSVGLALPAQAFDAEELNNGKFRFGPGNESSVTDNGLLKQPWYLGVDQTWYPLTYSDNNSYSYPIDMAFGWGTGGTEWNGNTNHVVVLDSLQNDGTLAADSVSVNSSGVSNGVGTLIITSVYDLDGNGKTIEVENKVTLTADSNFIKAVTKVTNTSGSEIPNFYVWVGTRDDWVGDNDDPTNERGNLVDGEFVIITGAAAASNAIYTYSDAEGSLFYSSGAGIATSIEDCCDFEDAVDQDPATSDIADNGDDSSYSISFSAGNLAAAATTTFNWFYAGGPSNTLSAVFEQVAEADDPVATPYLGPVVTNLARVVVRSGASNFVISGERLSSINKVLIDGLAATIVSQSNGELVITLPTLSAGLKDILMVSDFGTLLHQAAIEVIAAPAEQGKVNIGSFNGKLVVYAAGLSGETITWRVGGKWGRAVATGDYVRFDRPTPIKGLTVTVEIYVDGVKTLTKSVVTR